MPNTDPSPQIPQVQDKRPKIAGLLPKNAQQRVLGGIALLMILVMMFSGRKNAPTRTATVSPPGAAVDPNQARIQEYRARLDQETQQLAAEEAQLTQTKEALRPGAASLSANTPLPSVRAESFGDYRGAPAQSWKELAREKREYEAPFASNIALSYRRPAQDADAALPAANATTASPAIARSSSGQGGRLSSAVAEKPLGGPAANPYRVLEGTLIETVLTNRLTSSLSGPVNCLVTTNLYAEDHQTLLIPQGSRVLGEARKLESYGEQRLAVVFHRLVMPDGFTVSLDKFQGLSAVGETGLRDQVNNHYLQIFGVSIAIGAIAGLAQVNTRYSTDESAAQAYQQGVSASLSQSAMHVLDRYLNVLPTFTIREGYRIKIYLSQDLFLPSYDQHPVSGQL
jgi:type IV secretory pathway VirB10-like protein